MHYVTKTALRTQHNTTFHLLLQVIVAGAGGAAHLPGMVAAMTPLPVIGVPVTPAGAHLDGVDALLSIAQVRRESTFLVSLQHIGAYSLCRFADLQTPAHGMCAMMPPIHDVV